MFSKVGNRNAKFFHLKPRHPKHFASPDSPTLPLESPEFAGLQGDNLVGFLVDFFEQRHRRLEGSTNKSGKTCSTSRLKVATAPMRKKQNSFWWLTGSQGLQPKDSSVDSVFLSKMHHGCSRRLSFSCVIQHVWAKNCLMMYHV